MPYSATLIQQTFADRVYIKAFREMVAQRYQEGDRIDSITNDNLMSRDYYMTAGVIVWERGDRWVFFGDGQNASDIPSSVRRAIHDSKIEAVGYNDQYDYREELYKGILTHHTQFRIQKYLKYELNLHLKSKADQVLYIY